MKNTTAIKTGAKTRAHRVALTAGVVTALAAGSVIAGAGAANADEIRVDDSWSAVGTIAVTDSTAPVSTAQTFVITSAPVGTEPTAAVQSSQDGYVPKPSDLDVHLVTGFNIDMWIPVVKAAGVFMPRQWEAYVPQ